MAKSFFLLIVGGALLLFVPKKVFSEGPYHIPFDDGNLNHPAAVQKTSRECWHSQLMKISEVMVNDPESLPETQIEKDGKVFTYNAKTHASVEMMKGSRMEVFQTEDRCDLIIAFRGTYKKSFTTDLLQDLNFIPTKGKFDYHPGFVDVAESYRINIKKVIAESKKACGTQKLNITLTGHSLGGAVAYSVANILDGLDLGEPELVLFGTPRVVTHTSSRKDRVKAVHYYLDKDPIVLTPPAMLFRELTDDVYQFSKVPLSQKVNVMGHELIHNHLPSRYLVKMDLWCEGKEAPIRVKRFGHSLADSGYDASARVLRSTVRGMGQGVFPSKNKNGGNLPTIGQSFETVFSNSPWKKNRSVLLNSADGKIFARKLACSVTHFTGTKTRAGRAYYCNGSSGNNLSAEKACEKSCKIATGSSQLCLSGCIDEFQEFCKENWACPGDPIAGG